MNQTPNFQLNQWEADDRVQRTDFNADNAKIDAALAAIQGAAPKIAAGTYTGNGAASRTISLPFTPKAVLVFSKNGRTVQDGSVYQHYVYGGLAVTGSNLVPYENYTALAVCPGGFQVFKADSPSDKAVEYHILTNAANAVLHYIAIG